MKYLCILIYEISFYLFAHSLSTHTHKQNTHANKTQTHTHAHKHTQTDRHTNTHHICTMYLLCMYNAHNTLVLTNTL